MSFPIGEDMSDVLEATTRVFVIGKLGELVKKIDELESALQDKPSSVLSAELVSYNMVLAGWPVEDKDEIKLAIMGFRHLLMQYRQAEQRMASVIKDKNTDVMQAYYAREYFQCKQKVKDQMKMLNGMGKWIGDSQWLELVT